MTAGGGTAPYKFSVAAGTLPSWLTLNAGEVYFRKGGDTHAARNIDNHRYHEVLVELKA